jgi:hypothetical protein
MSMRTLLILVSLGILTAQSAYGTSAVIVWNPRTMVIGADGMVRAEDLAVMKSVKPQFCKIRRCGKQYWAVMAGLYSSGGVGYDGWAIINQACEGSRTIQTAAQLAETIIEPRLYSAIAHMKALGSAEVARLEKAGVYLQFAIAGFNGTIPTVSARQFRLGRDINPVEFPGTDKFDPQSAGRLLMGDYQAFVNYEATNPKWYFSNEVTSVIKDVLADQIKLEPEFVGPPISILSIGQHGATWIQKGLCGNKAFH